VRSDVPVRIWLTKGAQATHPEQSGHWSVPFRSTGVCFSGGSTRSHAATVGQLRGLTETGLIDQVGYLSAVSGGAWAVVPYEFYPSVAGVSSDRDILGSHRDPEDLSFDVLSEFAPKSIGSAATNNFAQALARAYADNAVARDEVWIRAIGQTFLAPFGLYDPKDPRGFTLNEAALEEIRSRHTGLRHLRLHRVCDLAYRPYLLVHSTLNWPSNESDLTRTNLIGFEYSPLGIGSGPSLSLRAGHVERAVGGGFVEPFAFGSAAPTTQEAASEFVGLTLPPTPFTLADAIGASSAFRMTDRHLDMYPHANYWPLSGQRRVATSEVFTDGGDVENYGLLSLLRRGVTAIVVFINTMWPVSLEYCPSNWPEDLNESQPTRREIDPFLAPLFGAPSIRFPHNQVFPEPDYETVISGLQQAKRLGGSVITTTKHVLQSNAWWGIDGGAEVEVCWCYNEHVERWACRLPSSVRNLLRDGQADRPDGPFARFPHYLTRDQNPGALIQLTAVQANLLAHLSCWNVIQNRDTLRRVLNRS